MDYLVYNIAALPESLADTSLFPPEEQEQAVLRGKRYALIRTLVRQELSRRCGRPAQEIRFSYGPQGKPEYAVQPFNLSHSADCLCLAFHHRPVGVDVEKLRPRAFSRLAERFMCPEQLCGFLERGCQQDEFYACWCAAEALVKHAGDTMWHALDYPFTYSHGRIICQFSPAPAIHLFTPMPGYCGAVAYTSE